MRRLTHLLNSDYIAAANRLASKRARRRIVAYVESYDDVFFWRNLLRPLETPQTYFEVMLPSRSTLAKGKKIAIENDLGERLGEAMIACVDADYDYLMQGATELSRTICGNPYIFHTYAYAIENFQCYAPALESVCVMATLNDRHIFDFERFFEQYSQIVWPLFAWNVWAYVYGRYKQFSLADFANVVSLDTLNFFHPEKALEKLRHRVNARVSRLQHQFPEGRTTYKPLCERLKKLGLTPQTTYLYMRGHDVFDTLVVPILTAVCDSLRRDREREIRQLAGHATQMQNELAAYAHATAPVVEMLRKHTAYEQAPLYQRIQADIRAFVERVEKSADESRNAEMPKEK